MEKFTPLVKNFCDGKGQISPLGGGPNDNIVTLLKYIIVSTFGHEPSSSTDIILIPEIIHL